METKLKMTIWVCALAAIMVTLPATVQANLLTNPDFETGDLTGWGTFGSGWRISGGADAHSGSFGVVDDIFATDTPGFRGVSQVLAATPGTEYTGSVWIRGVSLEAGKTEAWLEFQFLDGSNGVLLQLQSTHVTADQPFTFMSIASAVAPVGTVNVRVQGIAWEVAQPADTDFPIFDNFQFDVVPEPGTASLVAAGVIGLLVVRKQKG